MIASRVSIAPRTTATRAGTGREPAQLRPMASQPQTIAAGPRMIPSAKNPATAQTRPMIPSVARSGPACDPVRPRERGYLRAPFPKPAIVNSLDSGAVRWSGTRDTRTMPRSCRAVGALSPSGSAPQPWPPCHPEGLTNCDLRRVPEARNL